MTSIITKIRQEIQDAPRAVFALACVAVFCGVFIVFAAANSSWVKDTQKPTATTTEDSYALFSTIAKVGTTTAIVNGYTLTYAVQEKGSTVSISKDGKDLFETEGDALYFSPLLSITEQEEHNKELQLRMGSSSDNTLMPYAYMDLADASDMARRGIRTSVRNGTSVLVITGIAGSADTCAYDHNYVVELGTPLKVLWDQKGCASFMDTRKNDASGILFSDETFACWDTSCADSPHPHIVLSLGQTGYTPNLESMRQSPPSLNELQKRASSWVAKNCSADGCVLPLQDILDLIYSGNEKIADAYISLVWRDGTHFPSEEAFKNDLKAKLKESPYYNAVLRLNGGNIF